MGDFRRLLVRGPLLAFGTGCSAAWAAALGLAIGFGASSCGHEDAAEHQEPRDAAVHAPESGREVDAAQTDGNPTGDDATNAPSNDAASDASIGDGATHEKSLTFASGPDWSVYDDDPTVNSAARLLGSAVHVCITPYTPANCPPGALVFTTGGTGWTASLADVPGAHWVWGPGVVLTDISDLKRFVFVRTFTLGSAPSGWIRISADDYAEVRVNGTKLGSVGSITDKSQASLAQAELTTFDLSALLTTGLNTISVVAQNGPASYPPCSPACTYEGNPAGTVFGGVLRYR